MMVKVNYNGVSREKLLALGLFRREVIAMQNHYRPFRDDYLALAGIVRSIDDAMGQLIGDREVFHAKPDQTGWRAGDPESGGWWRERDK